MTVVAFSPTKAFWFTEDSGLYTAQYGAQQTLVNDSGILKFADTDGTVYEFDTANANRYQGCVTADGSTTVVSYNESGQITTILKSINHDTSLNPSSLQTFTYDDNGQIATITLQNYDSDFNAIDVSQATYTYYDSSDLNGNPVGELKSVVTAVPDGNNGWLNTGTSYYRYDSISGNLSEALTPQDYLNATAQLGNLDVQGTDPAAFASVDYAYALPMVGNNSYRIISVYRHGVDSGSICYQDAWGTPGVNTVQRESIEFFSQNCAAYIYTNFLGEVLGSLYYKGDTAQCTYNQYGSDSWDYGKLTVSAASSAVDSVSSTFYLLQVHLEPTGLFHRYTYYDSTDSTFPGAVAGQLESVQVLHGLNDENPSTTDSYQVPLPKRDSGWRDGCRRCSGHPYGLRPQPRNDFLHLHLGFELPVVGPRARHRLCGQFHDFFLLRFGERRAIRYG